MSQHDLGTMQPPEVRLRAREAAFNKYDGMVCTVLDNLRQAHFPRSYRVYKHHSGDWYLSPPDHVMGISPISVKLRFDGHNRPVAFRVTNYVDWTPVEECELSLDELNRAVRKLFPRTHSS